MQKRTVVVFFAALLGGGDAHAAVTGFQFKVPDGWVDLSPNAPPANFARLPPEMSQQLRAQTLAFYAADLDHGGGGYLVNVNAAVRPGAIAVDEHTVDELAASIERDLKKQGAPGTSYRVTSRALTKIGGVTVGRFLADVSMSGHALKQVGYLLPGHGEHALLTYAATPEEIDRYLPSFDAAAQATGGLVEAEEPLTIANVAVRSLAAALLVGGLAWLVSALRRKRAAPAK